MRPIHDYDYQSVVSRGKVVVEFTGSRCYFCRVMEESIAKVEDDYKDVKFFKYDTDVDKEICDQLNIASIPQVYYYRDGRLVRKEVGALSKEQLERVLDSLFG